MTVSIAHLLGRDGEADRGSVGGKAASLAQIRGLELPTPPGFCLTTGAHRLYLEQNALTGEVDSLQRRLPEPDARGALERLMSSAPLPTQVEAAMERGLAFLAETGIGDAPLAVRSSAIAEDGHNDSFAGQHESVLGASAQELETAVRKCWASLWSERAVTYRRERGLDFEGELMAVLVQPLLPSEVSAVAFTEDPIGGGKEEVVVCAVEGMGEPLVSGNASAFAIRVDRATLATLGVEGAQDGSNGAEATQPPVDEATVGDLVDGALRIERMQGRPVDVEAALVGGTWHFLQGRPITTGVETPARRSF
jgi:pyruvate,water dikinase